MSNGAPLGPGPVPAPRLARLGSWLDVILDGVAWGIDRVAATSTESRR